MWEESGLNMGSRSGFFWDLQDFGLSWVPDFGCRSRICHLDCIHAEGEDVAPDVWKLSLQRQMPVRLTRLQLT